MVVVVVDVGMLPPAVQGAWVPEECMHSEVQGSGVPQECRLLQVQGAGVVQE